MAITTTTVGELLESAQSSRVPYAIVSPTTGGYAVITGEIYRAGDGQHVLVEVDMGTLEYWAEDSEDEAQAVHVAWERSDVLEMER